MYNSLTPLNSFGFSLILNPPKKGDCIFENLKQKISNYLERIKGRKKEEIYTAALANEDVQSFIHNLSEEKEELKKLASEQYIAQSELFNGLEEKITIGLEKDAARKIKTATKRYDKSNISKYQ